MTQEEKLAARLKKLIDEPGLHEVKIFVDKDGNLVFWVVETKKVEGEK